MRLTKHNLRSDPPKMSSLRRITAAPSQAAALDYQDPQSHPFHWHYSEFDDSNFQIRGRTLFFIVVLFAIILLITFVVLYARWVCRFRPRPIQSAHAPQLVPPPPPRGLDPCVIDGIPITLHRSSGNGGGEAECCICLGIFQDGDKVKSLPQCRHCFHSECVDKWLRTQSNCPLCRTSLRFDSPV
ncbi:PREDICTED: RING-H2 finger protein ATL66 [Ipomoea nil]|uniref:RING-H2 finger protein ATL66 n=1 Tax=Ipomoea nil TaxID=35883 RepID=UPI0009012F53|nr:PREDICTED: RING-H2 finger protein ATL66 [Ipomoea nil]